MALAIIAEALTRIEHKIDLVLTRLGFLDKTPLRQLQFEGASCPVCLMTVSYQIDVVHGVVARKCGCTTGKLPPLIPLVPVPGAVNGPVELDADSSSDRRRRALKNSDRGEEG